MIGLKPEHEINKGPDAATINATIPVGAEMDSSADSDRTNGRLPLSDVCRVPDSI